MKKGNYKKSGLLIFLAIAIPGCIEYCICIRNILGI